MPVSLRPCITRALSGLGIIVLCAAGPAPAQFVDVTSGPLGIVGENESVVWGDYDLDGDHDLYLPVEKGMNSLLRNDGGMIFSDVSVPPINDGGEGEGAAWGDFDGDGDLDIYLANTVGGANKLFRNDGAGSFADVTTGPLGDTGNGEGVAWADYDQDGDVDLYLVNFGANRLLRNDGGGVFRRRETATGLAHSGVGRSAAFCDYDDDGDPDLFLTNELSSSVLFRNDSGVFTQVTSGDLLETGSWQGVDWGDYDGDGDPDLYVSNRSGVNRLFRNDGADSFVDATPAVLADSGVGFGVAWGDWDNDGDLDLYLVNDGPNRLFRNDGGTFQDVTTPPLDDALIGRGAAWCDVDGDGDLDLYIANFGGANRLFRNDLQNGNHWLQVDLAGVASSPDAIGARVRAVVAGSVLIREISGGGGYHSQPSFTVELGLGAAVVVDTLEVRWPSGILQTLIGIDADQRITIVEAGPPLAAGISKKSASRLAVHPVPFHPGRHDGLTIRFLTRREEVVRLEVFDVRGRRIRTLVESPLSRGQHEVLWSGRNDDGDMVPSGLYFLRLRTARTIDIERIPVLQ